MNKLLNAKLLFLFSQPDDSLVEVVFTCRLEMVPVFTCRLDGSGCVVGAQHFDGVLSFPRVDVVKLLTGSVGTQNVN